MKLLDVKTFDKLVSEKEYILTFCSPSITPMLFEKLYIPLKDAQRYHYFLHEYLAGKVK